jgi:hypothetical protein
MQNCKFNLIKKVNKKKKGGAVGGVVESKDEPKRGGTLEQNISTCHEEVL